MQPIIADKAAAEQPTGKVHPSLVVVLIVGMATFLLFALPSRKQKAPPEAPPEVKTLWIQSAQWHCMDSNHVNYHIDLGFRSTGEIIWRRGEPK